MMMFICHKKKRALWVRTLWLCQPMEGNTKGTHSGLTAQLKYDITTSRCQVASRCQIYQTKDYKKGQAALSEGTDRGLRLK